MATTIFGLGALGAAGTMAVALRSAAQAGHAARGGRQVAERVELLQGQLRAAGQNCAAVSPGSLTAVTGETVQWSLRPVSGGLDLLVSLSYPTPQGQHQDSLYGFLRCR